MREGYPVILIFLLLIIIIGLYFWSDNITQLSTKKDILEARYDSLSTEYDSIRAVYDKRSLKIDSLVVDLEKAPKVRYIKIKTNEQINNIDTLNGGELFEFFANVKTDSL